jgi:hypothetical protein
LVYFVQSLLHRRKLLVAQQQQKQRLLQQQQQQVLVPTSAAMQQDAHSPMDALLGSSVVAPNVTLQVGFAIKIHFPKHF